METNNEQTQGPVNTNSVAVDGGGLPPSDNSVKVDASSPVPPTPLPDSPSNSSDSSNTDGPPLTDKGIPEGVTSPDEIANLTKPENLIGVAEIPLEALSLVGNLLAAALANTRSARKIGIDSFGEVIEKQINQAAQMLGINFIEIGDSNAAQPA